MKFNKKSTLGEITMATIYDFQLQTIDGHPTTLEPYRGKVLLIVNVASK